MEWRLVGIDSPIFTTMDEDETIGFSEEFEGDSNFPSSRHHSRKSRGMLSTPADVKEYPNAYVFIIDMPGLKSTEIKVQIEDTNLLAICGIRKRVEEDDQEKERVKYVRMERRMGKFLRKFKLPDDANTDAVSAVFQDGVLNVTVEKLAPPEPKQPKSIEVKVA